MVRELNIPFGQPVCGGGGVYGGVCMGQGQLMLGGNGSGGGHGVWGLSLKPTYMSA